MKLKKIICIFTSVLLVLSGMGSASAKSIYPSARYIKEATLQNEKYSSSDRVTFIVELDGDPVLATKKAAQMGTDILNSEISKEMEEEIFSSQEAVVSSINNISGKEEKAMSSYSVVFNGFSIETSYGNMEKIKNIPGVKNVYICEDIHFKPHLSDSAEMILGAGSDASGYTGKGQLVAVIDNEFNVNHEFFSAAPENPRHTRETMAELVASAELNAGSSAENLYKNEKIPFAYDYYSGDYDTYSSSTSHGTHVAGIVGGKNGNYNGTVINGVAPDCQLLLMKIASNSGMISLDAMLLALEDAVKLGADVINCSIGADYYSPDFAPPIETGFANAHNAGVFVAVSAGNMARGFYMTDPLTTNIDYSSIGMPASISGIMAVASGNKSSSASAISSFSSYGVNDNLELKPEITAPGGGIVSSVRNSATAYEAKNGTSMASPHIAGAAAVMFEYFESEKMDISGNDRINLCQSLLMSSATIATNSSTGAVYSPRIQGAGVANILAATKSPVILMGDDGRCKISLGDELGESFNIKFTAKNISSEAVLYDKIYLKVLTDGYNVEDGKNYVSASRSLTVLSHTLPLSISLEAKSDAEVSAVINLDESELGELASVFTNGFFIDGFVCVEKNDGSLPALSIPFTGFYGDWTKAPAFDSTIYDAGGSTLVKRDAGVYETLLYTNSGNEFTVLGDNREGGYSKEYIALSPNSDGINDDIYFQLTPMRTITSIKSEIITSAGQRVSRASLPKILNKFYTANLSLNDISGLSDGSYTLRLGTLYNYEKTNPTEHVLSLPFYIDRQTPEIIKAQRNGKELSVTLCDNKKLGYAYTYYCPDGENIFTEVIHLPDAGDNEETVVSFDLEKIGAGDAPEEDIYIFVHDSAENYYCNSLSALTGDIHPLMKDDLVYISGIYSAEFEFISYKEAENCTLVLAFYDESGCLIHTDIAPGVTVANGSEHTFSQKANIDGAKKCRLFIWEDMKEYTPVDTSKAFSITID